MRSLADGPQWDMPSTHRVIHSAETTLPRHNGDRDITAEFDAPDISWQTTAQTRPYLCYRVHPEDSERVHLVMRLNGEVVVDQTLADRFSRSYHQVIEHGLLNGVDNELRVLVPSDEPGSVTVSDILVVYTSPEPYIPPNEPEDTTWDGGAGDL